MNETENRCAEEGRAEELRDEQLEKRAQELFAESTAGIDGPTRSRLTRARAEAIAAARKPHWLAPSRLLQVGLGAGAVAAAALVAVVLLQSPAPDVPIAATAALDDLEILLDEDELELYEELEFYAWLLEQPELLELETEDSSG